MREYRARKRQAEIAFKGEKPVVPPAYEISTPELNVPRVKRRAKTGAERMRAFRERRSRLKADTVASTVPGDCDGNLVADFQTFSPPKIETQPLPEIPESSQIFHAPSFTECDAGDVNLFI